MLKNLLLASVIIATSVVGQSVLAGDAEAGKAKSAVCAACHGGAGISAAPIYPNLAGQKEQYLLSSLQAYKAGTRSNPQMSPMAAPLSDEDMADLAAYYASLSCN